MLIGVPKELKSYEYRVGLVPSSVRELTTRGHTVLVQHHAGEKIGFDDVTYERVGAKIIDTAEEIFQQAELIVKVKEPQPVECRMLREGQVIFTYLHLAPDPEQAKLLQESRCIAIAYETVTGKQGGLPLLSPMSEVAGRMSIQAGNQTRRQWYSIGRRSWRSTSQSCRSWGRSCGHQCCAYGYGHGCTCSSY